MPSINLLSVHSIVRERHEKKERNLTVKSVCHIYTSSLSCLSRWVRMRYWMCCGASQSLGAQTRCGIYSHKTKTFSKVEIQNVFMGQLCVWLSRKIGFGRMRTFAPVRHITWSEGHFFKLKNFATDIQYIYLLQFNVVNLTRAFDGWFIEMMIERRFLILPLICITFKFK